MRLDLKRFSYSLSGVRARLALLALAAVMPIAAYIVYEGAQNRAAEIEEAKAQLGAKARLAAAELDAVIGGTMQLLDGMSHAPELAEPARCPAFLASVHARYPKYASLTFITPAGDATCFSLPGAKPTHIGDREYFQRVRASGRPEAGAPVLGRASGTFVLPVIRPVHTAAGEVRGYVFAGVDLGKHVGSLRGVLLDPLERIVLWSHDGLPLARYPDPEGLTGKPAPATDIAQIVAARMDGVSTQVIGLDGRVRVRGIALLPETRGTGIRVTVSVPVKVLTAKSGETFQKLLAAAGLVLLAALALAWMIGEGSIRRPLARLATAGEKLGTGNFAVRIGAPYPNGEIGALMAAFDRTAAALESQSRERGKAEEALRALNDELEGRVAERSAQFQASEERIRLLLDSSGEGIYGVDTTGKCIFCNPACARLAGYADPAALLGRNMHEILHHSRAGGASYPVEDCRLYRAFLDGTEVRVDDEVFWRADGSSFPVEYWSYPMRRRGGIIGAVVFFVDISERRRAQAEIAAKNSELERANAALAHANEMKSQFLATMSHELRTPLNAIIGFAEVLRDGLAGGLNVEQRNFAHEIQASGRHLLELINDILDLSKIEAGMMTLEPVPVRIEALFQGSVSVVKERALKRRLRLETQIEAGLPDFSADARKLKQILFNLLGNAVKFTPDNGAVTLAARRVPRAGIALPRAAAARLGPPPASAAAEFIEISVRDTGIGIAPADMERLFQAFMQVDSSLAREHAGTGLGLAMVKSLAELHGGTFGAASDPGGGSTFFVWLPLAATRVEGAPAAEFVRPAPAAAPLAGPPLALVIEDEDDAARLIEETLRAEGFRTMRSATGEEGLVRAAKDRPQLITLDIFLPNMDGWSVIQRLKATPALGDIPVVLISITGERDHGLALGATRVLQKPFTRAELRAALAGIVALEPGAKPCTVLIADDNPAAVELLATHLAGTRCSVLRAYGGREAIEAAGRAAPDLILLDLMMPDVSGFEVVQTLKARPETAAIPIVVVTAKELTTGDRALLNGAVQRVLMKSHFDRAEFLNEVRRAVQRSGAEARS